MTEEISLRRVLPHVFRGSENELPVRDSQLWLQENMTFRRGTYYLIEAESGTGKSSLCSYIYGSRHDYDGKILLTVLTPGVSASAGGVSCAGGRWPIFRRRWDCSRN